MQTGIVSPNGEIIISAEWTTALDLRAGDRVSFELNGGGLVVTPKAPTLQPPGRDASLEEKIAYYNSPEFIQSVTDRVNAARADVSREMEHRIAPPAPSS